MKKVLIFLLSLGVSGAAFAQMPPVSVGLGMGFELQNATENFNNGGISGTRSLDSSLLNVGIAFDATYLVAKLQYAGQLGKSKFTNKTNGQSDQSNDVDRQMSFLDLSVAGKYPINLAMGIAIFPLVGLEYDLNLSASNLGGQEKQSDLNDLYLLLGLGVDIHVTPTVYFRPEVNYGFNLTANPSNTASGSTYTGNKMTAGISVGYGL